MIKIKDIDGITHYVKKDDVIYIKPIRNDIYEILTLYEEFFTREQDKLIES